MCLREGIKKIARNKIERLGVDSGIQFLDIYEGSPERKCLNLNNIKGKIDWYFSLFFKSSLMLCRVILMLDISGT